MTAAPKYGSLWKLHCRDTSVRRARFPWCEAGVLEEEMNKCTRGGRRGMGPGACAGVAEIMSGRTVVQHGLTNTCKDLTHNGTTGGVRRVTVRRMSPYEQRRRGNALPGGRGDRPAGGNALRGQRGSGHSVATEAEAQPDFELDLLRSELRGEGAKQTPWCRGEGRVSAAASYRGGRPALINGVQSRGQNRTRENRPSGIVGGLQETWPMVELGTHPATER